MDIPKAIQEALDFHRSGNLREAEQIYREILRVKPDNADALHYLGVVFYQLGDFRSSIHYLMESLRCNPMNPDTCNNIGNAFKENGQLDEAVVSYQKALLLNPGLADAYFNLGNVFKEQKKDREAVIYYRKALKLDPGLAGAYYYLGVIHQSNKAFDEAVDCYRNVIQLSPGFSMAYNDMGTALQEKGEIDEAMTFYSKALEIDPGFAGPYNNLGFAMQEKGKPDEAISFYRKAIELKPDFVDAHYNLGNALQEKGLFDDAVLSYKKALEFDAVYIGAHWNLAHALLLTGRFREGWSEYEWRSKLAGYYRRDFPHRWDGSDAKGLTVLLHTEQGLGDAIQFVRYAPLVAERGAKVVIECQKELVSLIRRVEGVSEVISRGDQIPEFDAHCPLLSLPLVFDTGIESLPARIPYLSADSKLVEWWGKRIRRDSDHFAVGLAWSGNPKHKNDEKRSCRLESFAPLAELGVLTFYSLQKGEAGGQAKNPPEGMTLNDYSDSIHDFSDTAALIMNLDLVISVDTAVAHLAGALGKQVWTILPYAPDWRWMIDRDDSPWYPTMRLFRQQEPNDWESVIRSVAVELAKMKKTGPLMND